MFLDKLELNNDEAIIGVNALSLILPKVPFTRLRHLNSLTIFSSYKGKVSSFPEAIFFKIFGSSVFTLRFVQVLFSLGSLMCIYYVCSRNFNRFVGIFTILLLGIDSSFIRVTRIGNMQDAVLQIFLFWLGIALIQLYMDKKRRAFLYTSGFVFGVALWAKLMFLGYFLGALAGFLVFGKKSYVFLRKKIFKKKLDIAVFIAAFILGSAPLLIFNIFNHWPIVTSILNSFKDHSTNIHASGWNNMNFLHNFKIRVGNFHDLLNSQISGDGMSTLKNNVNLLLFYLSFSVVLLYLLLAEKGALSKNKISFFIITYGVLLSLSCFIPEGGSCDPAHVVILLPIVQIVEALFFSLIIIYSRNIYSINKLWAYLIILLMFIPHAYKEFNIMRKIGNDLKNEENVICLSLAGNLTSYLNSNNIQEVFCFDNPLLGVIDFLSDLKIISWGFNVHEGSFWPHPVYGVRNFPEGSGGVTVESVYECQLKGLNPFYMIRNKNNDFSENGFQRLKKLIERDKKQLILMKTFANDANKAEARYLELYRVEEDDK